MSSKVKPGEKKIYVLCDINLKHLPPALSLILCLHELNYNVKFIAPYIENEYKTLFHEHNIVYYEYTTKEKWDLGSVPVRVYHKVWVNYVKYNKFIFNILRTINKSEDLVWILHEDSAFKLSREICDYNYYLSVYELNKPRNMFHFFRSHEIEIARHAKKVITPEYNRSFILYANWKLKRVPAVLPNKPYEITGETQDSAEVRDRINRLRKLAGDKKLIIYQGAFGYDRKLEPFIDAVKDMEEYQLVFMGNENDYLKQLVAKYGDKLLYLPALSAPQHLEITKLSYIGIISYQVEYVSRYDPLNVVYCAPNKIFEYSKYSIPMICTNQPGLYYTVEKYNAGICVDCDNPDSIKNAVIKISNNYEQFRDGSNHLFNSVDLQQQISDLVEK